MFNNAPLMCKICFFLVLLYNGTNCIQGECRSQNSWLVHRYSPVFIFPNNVILSFQEFCYVCSDCCYFNVYALGGGYESLGDMIVEFIVHFEIIVS